MTSPDNFNDVDGATGAGSADAASATTSAPAPSAARAQRERIDTLSWLVIVVFGILYAYDLWEAIANLVGLGTGYGWNFYANVWILLIVGVLSPIAVFTVAVWLGRRKQFWERGLILLAGWAVVAAFTLTIYSLFVAAFQV